MNTEQLLEKYPHAEQLIKEIPENAVRTWYGRTFYPGSEYWRLYKPFTSTRVYKNMGRGRQAETTITEDAVIITGGGFGGIQFYPKGHYKFNFWVAFFDMAEQGKFMGFSK